MTDEAEVETSRAGHPYRPYVPGRALGPSETSSARNESSESTELRDDKGGEGG